MNFFSKLKINFTHIHELMSRDFIIYFSDEKKTKIAEEILNNIELKNKKFFKIDNRGSDLFISLVYPDEILKNDYINFDSIEIFKDVLFIAIKNGMHHEKGFYYDNFSDYNKNDMNIVDIKNKILNFFK